MFTVTVSFAFTGGTINKQLLNTFRSEFAGATDVAWAAGNNYYRVAFTINDQKLIAFYNSQGEFIAVTHFISTLQLPHNLQKSLKRTYKSYWVSDLFEMKTADETGYFVTLENADTKIVLKSIDGGNWSLYLKNNKE